MKVRRIAQDASRVEERIVPADVLADLDRDAAAAPLGDAAFPDRPGERDVAEAENRLGLAGFDVADDRGAAGLDRDVGWGFATAGIAAGDVVPADRLAQVFR